MSQLFLMKFYALFFAMFINAPLNQAGFEDQFCCLCEDCDYPLRDELLINPFGLTCARLDGDMINPDNDSKPGNNLCIDLQNEFRTPCCDPEADPVDVPQISTPAPSPTLPPGDEPYCDLCEGGAYPTKPYTLVAAAYIPGTNTCADLYWMGRKGHIDGALCYPMQIFLKDACGCLPPSPEPTPAPTPKKPTIPQMKMRPPTKKDDLKLGYPGDRERSSGGMSRQRMLVRGVKKYHTSN